MQKYELRFLSLLTKGSYGIMYLPYFIVVDCGSLASPKFGQVVISGTTFGSTATYSCQKGYILVGDSTRVCQVNGQWSGDAPTCKSMFNYTIPLYRAHYNYILLYYYSC